MGAQTATSAGAGDGIEDDEENEDGEDETAPGAGIRRAAAWRADALKRDVPRLGDATDDA
jgi:hypothetical protein